MGGNSNVFTRVGIFFAYSSTLSTAGNKVKLLLSIFNTVCR